ncbi:hypothetical protein PGS49_22720 [Yersinia intermedia]|nr:hypothetical protein [Yersinia intermedia]MDA5483411.1 hypothetical protein [Yersinia intermedia]
MMSTVNWGVLSYARIAQQNVIPAIERASNAQLLGIASRAPSRLPNI